MVSSMGQQCFISKAKEFGAIDFIVKPFKFEEILDVLKKIT